MSAYVLPHIDANPGLEAQCSYIQGSTLEMISAKQSNGTLKTLTVDIG